MRCDSVAVVPGEFRLYITHLISADGIYDLPLGKGRLVGRNASGWLNQIIGGWQVAFLNQWHTGFAFTTVSEAFPVSFNANSPAVFIGKQSTFGCACIATPTPDRLNCLPIPQRRPARLRGRSGCKVRRGTTCAVRGSRIQTCR